MQKEDISNLLDIIENMLYTNELIAEEIYKSLGYTNSTFDLYAQRYRDISLKLFELKEKIKDEY